MVKKNKVRINISIKPDLLKRIDAVADHYGRSEYMSEACEEKMEKKKSK